MSENGWLEVAEAEGFIMIAPFYGSYDSVYRHTDYFADILRDALVRYPMIDKSRVYVTGFSNGGAAAVALTDQYPELFAAIAPEGKKVVVMEPVKGGVLAQIPETSEKQLRAVDPEISPAGWAIRYAAFQYMDVLHL